MTDTPALAELRAWCVGLRESNRSSSARWEREEEMELAREYEIHAAALSTIIDKIDAICRERSQ